MEDLLAVLDKNALILDPFAGATSTGIAAIRTGRRFIGCEQDQTYYEIARNRLQVQSEELGQNFGAN